MSLLSFFAEPKNNTSSIILLVVVLVAFVGILVYSSFSQKKRQKQAVEQNAKLTVGDRVKSIGGIIGVIETINEEMGTFIIRTGDRSMEIDRNAVYALEAYATEGTTDVEKEVSDVKTEEVSEKLVEEDKVEDKKTDEIEH